MKRVTIKKNNIYLPNYDSYALVLANVTKGILVSYIYIRIVSVR